MSEQQPSGNLLSNVNPPSALPSFIIASPASGTISTASAPTTTDRKPNTSISENASTNSSKIDPFIPTTFSAAIPPSKDTSAIQSPASDTVPSNLDNMTLNPEPVASALDPITHSGTTLFTWMKDAAASSGDLLHKVAEKAKSSVDTIVTTLDPQMKEYIYSGGDIEIIVASDKDDKVRPIREAFQTVFGKATILGLPAQPKNIAAQPVGFEAALRGAQERTADIRTNCRIGDKIPVIAIENFIVEAFPDQWFDAGLLLLTDPLKNINLKIITQMTSIPLSVIATLKEDVSTDYEFKDTGFPITVGHIMANNLKVHHTEWHKAYTGVNRSDMILNAAKSLASLYKQSRPEEKDESKSD